MYVKMEYSNAICESATEQKVYTYNTEQQAKIGHHAAHTLLPQHAIHVASVGRSSFQIILQYQS